MTLADTSGNRDHLQTAQLPVLHSCHTTIGLPELPLLKMTPPNMRRLYCFSSFLKLGPPPQGLGKLSLTSREQASPHHLSRGPAHTQPREEGGLTNVSSSQS